MNEFDLIKQWFTWPQPPNDVSVSVGDDAAVLQLPSTEELVVSVDTSISGVHFPIDTSPAAIAHKALAVNLSDLAAMGATPRWFTLALTLPEIDQTWLNAFAQGLSQLAQQAGIFLVGGDTTRGTLSITIQVMGSLPKNTALLRSGAKAGDIICVSGTLGDAAAGLASSVQHKLALPAQAAAYCQQRLNYPTPRNALGTTLRDLATSCIDISDGLLADLGHILQASQVGARLRIDALPLSNALQVLPIEQAREFAVNGGDDYELLFTLPAEKLTQIYDKTQKDSVTFRHGFTKIGIITTEKNNLEWDSPLHFPTDGYNHFR